MSDNGLLSVAFDDGRPLADFDVSTGEGSARHACGDDLYDGTVSFGDKNGWTWTWRVQGPRKDYVMRSRMIRDG